MASFKLFKRKEVETAQMDAAENAIALKEVEGLSQRQIVFKRFVHHRAAMVALFTLITIILVVNTEEEAKEYVYDTERKLVRVVKQYLGEKVVASETD